MSEIIWSEEDGVRVMGDGELGAGTSLVK